ncbi:MAG: hypothetical protein EOP06_04140 [Proteobacteria bacterium]|nr:MAG: hypothetical protein EOP06_04140 [Pseudomonadota bacterium]
MKPWLAGLATFADVPCSIERQIFMDWRFHLKMQTVILLSESRPRNIDDLASELDSKTAVDRRREDKYNGE